MPDLAAVYLTRLADGPESVERFAVAYRRHPAGVPHDLVVILKGFDADPAARTDFLARLAGLTYTTVEVPDVRFDLGAYFAVAPNLPHEYVGLFNSHSEPLADGWLAHLSRHARAPGVGLAGATGSFESTLSAWLHSRPTLDQVVPARLATVVRRLPGRMSRWLARHHPRPRYPMPYNDFHPFPNPHLRTTGFVIARKLFVELRDNPLRDKTDALRLEGGRSGLTRQVQARGLRPVIVGRDGRGYDVPDWPHSRTFRAGDQGNLLVGDNHTRHFAAAAPAERAWLSEWAWGPAAATTEGTR